jgi:hypothetical protein
MSQDHLVDLARLSIESEIASKINFANVITSSKKAPLNAIVKLVKLFYPQPNIKHIFTNLMP